jgi:hypothetical protein
LIGIPLSDAPIHRLIYVSRLTREAGSRLSSTTEDILRASVRNNRRSGLTGFLLCDGDQFVQVLEGMPEDVGTCYQRIATDPRHVDLVLKASEPAQRSAFPRWSMCALYLSDLDDTLLHPSEIEFELREASPGALLQHLTGLAHRHGDALDHAHDQLMARYRD